MYMPFCVEGAVWFKNNREMYLEGVLLLTRIIFRQTYVVCALGTSYSNPNRTLKYYTNFSKRQNPLVYFSSQNDVNNFMIKDWLMVLSLFAFTVSEFQMLSETSSQLIVVLSQYISEVSSFHAEREMEWHTFWHALFNTSLLLLNFMCLTENRVGSTWFRGPT